jgi:hypothetical protein
VRVRAATHYGISAEDVRIAANIVCGIAEHEMDVRRAALG